MEEEKKLHAKIQSGQIKVYSTHDFTYYEPIGEGSYGQVRKCKLKDEIYNEDNGLANSPTKASLQEVDQQDAENEEENFQTVKLQSKLKRIKGQQIDHLYREIDLMSELDHPFILKLRGVSQEKRMIGIYTDLIKYGDITSVQRFHENKKIPIKIVAFYTAQMVLCLEYMHSKGIVYRDMKPENILLARDGYLKLADFGFVKKLGFGEKTYTICGTPEYIAPEIFDNRGHGHAVDFYSLGILIYELLYGDAPFRGTDTHQIFKQALYDKIKFPQSFDPQAKDLVKKLCAKCESKRLGNMVDGIDEIKQHQFFAENGIDFQKLLDKQYPAQDIFLPPYQVETAEGPTQYQKKLSFKEIDEFTDIPNFPPIKAEKDPFLNWF